MAAVLPNQNRIEQEFIPYIPYGNNIDLQFEINPLRKFEKKDLLQMNKLCKGFRKEYIRDSVTDTNKDLFLLRKLFPNGEREVVGLAFTSDKVVVETKVNADDDHNVKFDFSNVNSELQVRLQQDPDQELVQFVDGLEQLDLNSYLKKYDGVFSFREVEGLCAEAGQGFGKLILDKVNQNARDVQQCKYSVLSSVSDATGFYEKMGYAYFNGYHHDLFGGLGNGWGSNMYKKLDSPTDFP
eukprot:Pgem_evm1s2525